MYTLRTNRVKLPCAPSPVDSDGESARNAGMPAKPTQTRNFIREWRMYAGVTQEQLAEAVGVTHASIQRYETRKQAVSADKLSAIAKRLNCTPSELLSRSPHEDPEIWPLWNQATPDQKRQIVRVVKSLIAAE